MCREGTPRAVKLLFLIHSLAAGGAERVTANLANHWADKGWQVGVATLATSEGDFYPLHPAVERFPLGIAKISPNAPTALVHNLNSVRAIRKLLLRYRPEAAVAMMTTSNILLALAGFGLAIRTVGSERIHPPMVPIGRVWHWLRRLTYGRLDHMVALTEQSADWLRKNTSAQRVTVIPNPVLYPLATFKPTRDPASVTRSGRSTAISVGRLERQKGYDLLLVVFGRIAHRLPSWDLIIIGEGEDHEMLQQQIRELGLEERVQLVGRVGNIGDWYDAADLYVMPSRFEGFPNTLAEAMAHGLAAISFDCDTGPRELISHEVDGLLVPAGNLDQLEDALYRLMGDDALRRQLAAEAIKARTKFSILEVARIWEETLF